jgi:hypothetical protein
MTFMFRPAARENVSLLIGLSGGTGSGKTYTAMRLAKGIAGDRPFAVIDTEAGRALHYGDRFRFDHGDLKPPFSPDNYAAAIKAADDAKYSVILVDSASHEWAGEGGILDMQEAELDRMAGTDWKKREAVKMASWIRPKMQHKRLVQQLLQVRAHLILCFRAEPKIEMVRVGVDGKMEIRDKQSLTGLNGWIPICEKNLPFEMTASFLLMADKPGVPLPIKLQEQHKDIFPSGRIIDESCGARLSAWARGAAPAAAIAPQGGPQVQYYEQLIAEWSTRIAGATTKAELLAINRKLKANKDSMPVDVIAKLRVSYEARLAALSPAPSAPLLASDIPFGR